MNFDDALRLEALADCRMLILDTPEETAFDNLTQLAARVFATPIALVSLVDEKRQWFQIERRLWGPRNPPRRLVLRPRHL